MVQTVLIIDSEDVTNEISYILTNSDYIELFYTLIEQIMNVSNKLYSYALSGCHSFISKTPAQEHFLKEFPDAGQLIDLNRPDSIAESLRSALENRDELLQNRQRAWQLGDTALNWEKESEVLVGFVHRYLRHE